MSVVPGIGAFAPAGIIAPTIAGSANDASGSAGTSWTATLPASIAAGELIMLFVNHRGSTATINTPAGYTALVASQTMGTNLKSAVFYKTAAGGETSVTLTSGGNMYGSCVALRIKDWGVVPTVSTVLTGTGTPNPPNNANSADLWIAAMQGSYTGRLPTSPPSGFTVLTNYDGTSVNGSISVTYLASPAASKDPGAFTMPDALQEYGTYTIGLTGT